MERIDPELRPYEIGGGQVKAGAVNNLILPARREQYANAQLDDHRHLPRGEFSWQPPVRLELRARCSHAAPLGTLGFGFWNDPFAISLGQAGAARRLPAAPQALWFFYGSPPNDMSFVNGVAGHGWKAASLRTPRLPSWLLALPAGVAAALSALPLLRRPVIRAAKAAVTAAECELPAALDQWHHYRLDWNQDGARFWVDDELVLAAPQPPAGRLGFVAWIDNQYAVVTERSGLKFGVLSTDQEQRLDLAELRFTSATPA